MASSPRRRAAREQAPPASAAEERPIIEFQRLTEFEDNFMTPEASGESRPPFNIERTGESDYRLTLVVSEYEVSELAVGQQSNVLAVRGSKTLALAGQILSESRFHLAHDLNATRATLQDGLLLIDLQKSPFHSVSMLVDNRGTNTSDPVSLKIYESSGKDKAGLNKGSLEFRSERVATHFKNWDITNHPIWKSVQDRYPGARIFRLYVPETGIFVYDDGKFSANGELLIVVPTTRRSGEPDVAHLTVLVDFGGRAGESFELESVGLRGEAPIPGAA